MKQVKKSALFAAIAGTIASSAFGGFIDVTAPAADFTNPAVVPGSGSDMYWANLGLFDVPANFMVDTTAAGFTHDVGSQGQENGKAFGSLAAGKYYVIMFLADPISAQAVGDLYSESFDVSSLGIISGFSYWDGRYGPGNTDTLAQAISLVNGQGGGYTFDTVSPGRGFESHEYDQIPGPQPQDAFSISADRKTIDFDLWAFEAQQAGDPFVDMAFAFIAPIPEPSTIVFALTGGVLGLLLYRNAGRRRQS